MRCAALGLVLAACGRFEFSPVGADGGADSSDAPDARPDDPVLGLVVRFDMDADPVASGVALASDETYNGACTTCPVLVSGHRGGGYMFNATASISLPIASSALTGSAPYSVTVWANMTMGALVAKPLSSVGTSNAFAIQLNTNMLYFETAEAGAPVDLFATQDIRSAWHHVAVTWDGASKRLYIDGALDGTMTATPVDSNLPFVIGADVDNGAVTNRMLGTLDDLRFYNRTLTDADVMRVFAD